MSDYIDIDIHHIIYMFAYIHISIYINFNITYIFINVENLRGDGSKGRGAVQSLRLCMYTVMYICIVLQCA